jgi:hypothetical protein
MLDPAPTSKETPSSQGLGVSPGLPSPLAGAPIVHAGRCCRAGCDARAVVNCAYQDSHGSPCPAELCIAHAGGLAAGAAYCARHSAVAAALAHAGVHEARPDVDDRRFSLLLGVHSDLSDEVVALLGRHREAGVEVASDAIPVPVRRGGAVAWECGWSSYATTDNLHRVSLRVASEDPACVLLLVDQALAAADVPYWITRRLSGAPPDPRDRPMFAGHLARLVATAIAAQARPSWLPA